MQVEEEKSEQKGENKQLINVLLLDLMANTFIFYICKDMLLIHTLTKKNTGCYDNSYGNQAAN